MASGTIKAVASKADVDALNSKLNATQITGSTKSAVESSLETFGSAMSNGEIRRIWFAIATASAPFMGTTYVGTIERQENRFIVLINGISTVGQDLVGFYKSGTGWAWQNKLKEIHVNIAAEIPTITELKDAVTSVSGSGTYVMTFHLTSNGEARSAMIYNAASASYGVGIMFTYYSSSWYKVKNTNQTLSMTAF